MADINLGGSVGTSGAPILGRVTVNISGDTDITLNPTQYTNYAITVTSDGGSTGPRKVIAPLVQGSFLVTNATTEGYPIIFTGPTGTGVSIPINVTAICASNGINFVLPNANAAGSAPVNAGAVEITGQPVTNSETLGSHLQIQQDQVGTQIDGTYGDGSLPWNVGVWTFLGHSIIRTPGLDNTKPILRIPFSTGVTNFSNKKPQWDKPSNRMYVPDDSGPRIYVIDTTPQVDPTGSYVAGCPGIIQTIDLSSTPVASGFSMVTDIATGTFWCFHNKTAVAIPFNGLTHTTYTLPQQVTDATYANGHVWVASYDTTTFQQYVSSVSSTGILNAGVLVCTPPGAPGLPNQITYDIVNDVLWTVGNDSNVFGTLTMLGATPTYPTATTLYHWTDVAGACANITTLFNGHLVLNTFILTGVDYTPAGVNSGFWGILAGGPFNEPSPFFFCGVYDPVGPTQYVFSANNVSGVVNRSTFNNSASVYAYAGGLQEWVAGGGGTASGFAFINEASVIDIFSETATNQLIVFNGDFPTQGGNSLSLTTNVNFGKVSISGLTGFNKFQNTEGGATITITGASDPLNNGTFPFVADFTDATIGTLTNFSPGALPDANNGNISWSIKYQVLITFPNTGAIGPKLLDWTQVTGIQNCSSIRIQTIDTASVDYLAALNVSKLTMVAFDGGNPFYVQPILINSSTQTVMLPQGTIDPIEGQPIQNEPINNGILVSMQDAVWQVIDGSYLDGIHLGFWICLGHSIIRINATDPTIPILRIPMPTGFTPALQRTMQWDPLHNRLYVLDSHGPKIYVIDTTPALDPTNQYVVSVPGIISVVDLSTTPFPTGFGGQTYTLFAVDVPNTRYVLIDNAINIGLAGFDGSTLLAPNNNNGYTSYGDAFVDSAGDFIYTATYGTPVNTSPLTIGFFGADQFIGGSTGANYLAYDPTLQYIWATAGDAVYAFTYSYPTVTTIHNWTASGTVIGAPIPLQNGNVVLPIGTTLQTYSSTGTLLFTQSIPAGFTFNTPNTFVGTRIGTPAIPGEHDIIAAGDNKTGFVIQTAAPDTTAPTEWLFLGGVQYWETSGGGGNAETLPQKYGFTQDGQRVLNPISQPAGPQPGIANTLQNIDIEPFPSNLSVTAGRPYQILDATLGTGTEVYRDGFWAAMPGSIIRMQTNNQFVTRIPLDINFVPSNNRSMAWDKITNKLYVSDAGTGNFPGSAIWTIDTTPTPDATNNTIVNFNGPVTRQSIINQYRVNGATNASPIVISTEIPNRINTGDLVSIIGVSGNIAANGFWVATRIDAKTFSLLNSTGNGNFVYDGGGAITNYSDRESLFYQASAPNGIAFDGTSVWALQNSTPWFYKINPATGNTTAYQLSFNNPVLNTTATVVTVTGSFYGNSGLVGQNLTITGAGNSLNNGTYPIGSYLPPPTGNVASLNALGGNITLSGGSGFYPELVNQLITIFGCASPTNNGQYQIIAYNDPTSIVFANGSMPDGPDANNGSIGFDMGITASYTIINSNSPDGADSAAFASLVSTATSFSTFNEIYFTKQLGLVPASIWLTDANNPNVYQIDPATGNIINVIALSAIGSSMASTHEFSSPVDSFLYVGAGTTLSVIDMTGTPTQIDSISIPFLNSVSSVIALNDAKQVNVWGIGNPSGVINVVSNTGGSRWDGSGGTTTLTQIIPTSVDTDPFNPLSNYALTLTPPTQSSTTVYSPNLNIIATYPSNQQFYFVADATGTIFFTPDDGVTSFSAWAITEGSKIWIAPPGEPVRGPGSKTAYYRPGSPGALTPFTAPFANNNILEYYSNGSSQSVSGFKQAFVQNFALQAESRGTDIVPPDLMYQVFPNAPREPEITAFVGRHDVTTAAAQGTTTTSGNTASILAGSPTFTIISVPGQHFYFNIDNLYITISGAADPNNNGTFKILNGFNTLEYYNPNNNGTTDANNGSIGWLLSVPIYTLPLSYPDNPENGTDGSINTNGGTVTFTTGATLPLNLAQEIITISGSVDTATGSTGSITVTNGINVFTGFGFAPNIVGQSITISGAADANNNGTFPVTFYNGTIVFDNLLATTDANNGSLSWSWTPNNGRFTIPAVLNANSLFYSNFIGIFGNDSNNGSLTWSIDTPDGYACQATVKMLACGIINNNSIYSSQLIVDVANPGSPTQLFAYNPLSLTPPQFIFTRVPFFGNNAYTLMVTIPSTTSQTYWNIVSDISYLQTRS